MDGKETRGICDEVVTDNEIIKAYERCFTLGFDESTCYECPFYTATAKCTEDLRDSALALINRQKAEIEESKTEIERMEIELTEYKLRLKMSECTVDEIKSEAIKEFMNRLKKCRCIHDGTKADMIFWYHIEYIAKEMTEE